MKILLDGRFYGIENAGLGRYTINLIRELQNIDKENHYLVLLRKKYFNQLNFPENWEKVLADYRHYSFAEQIKLPKLISFLKPDLVHFLHFNVPIFYRGSFVVTIHDILMHGQRGLEATTLPLPSYYFKRLGYKLVFRRAVLGAKKIITPSNAVKKEIIDYYKIDSKKVIVTYEGLDEEVLENKDKKEVLGKYKLNNQYFVYAGNAYPHKNLKRAIEAILLLNDILQKGMTYQHSINLRNKLRSAPECCYEEREEKIILVIVSARNVFRERIEKIVKKMKAAEYIKVLDLVPDKELGSLYKNSLAFVFPSLSEGFGLPGLEAMAAGTLVLASDIPVFKEIYQGSVVYFNPYDFFSIEEAMKNVLQIDKEKREEIISKSQSFIKRYSWRKMAEETLKVYESCSTVRPG